MAVVAAGTVVHIPFPSRLDYKSLEPDGLATLRLNSVGDGTGGGVLHTFRGQAGFLYILRGISAELTETITSTGTDVEIRLDAQWIADAAGQSQGDWFSVLSMAVSGPEDSTRKRSATSVFVNELLGLCRLLPLGKLQRTGDHDILSMQHRANDDGNLYVSNVLFDAYRTEAFTVPGILNQLRGGLIR